MHKDHKEQREYGKAFEWKHSKKAIIYSAKKKLGISKSREKEQENVKTGEKVAKRGTPQKLAKEN